MKRSLLFLIAHEAHMMGRIYNKMGEPENPDGVCTMLNKMVDQKIKENASQSAVEADAESRCTCYAFPHSICPVHSKYGKKSRTA